VLFNWLTPDHARASAQWVRDGAATAGRQPPTLWAYVRVALGAGAGDRLAQEGARYAGIPAYASHFARMGVKPVETAIAVASPDAIRPGLERWRSVVDEVVVRAVTASDTLEENLALLRAARPPGEGG
jgi:alkanesulfonate monooxygenase SsuD/methylene tetrahydromethanopterin reductase-like flavin-dependent oxidoreductase (luciferase family)